MSAPTYTNEFYTYDHSQLLEAEHLHQAGDQTGLDHHLDAVVGAVREVGDGPAGVGEHLRVVVVEQADQGGQDLLHGSQGRGGVLVAAEVRQRPRHVAEIAGL